MARIPYLPEDLSEPADVVAAIRARRGGSLLHLDRMLLHSPPLARGWNVFLGAVRTELSLNARLRELAMCTVAVLNGADYEFAQHAPLLAEAGASAAQVNALHAPHLAAMDEALFPPGERAALAVIIAMTREVKVDDRTMEELRAHLSNREVVELCAVTAAYNMVSRFLVATGIHARELEPGAPATSQG